MTRVNGTRLVDYNSDTTLGECGNEAWMGKGKVRRGDEGKVQSLPWDTSRL